MAKYEIRYSTSFFDVTETNFNRGNSTLVTEEIITDGSLEPLEAGLKQNVTFVMLKEALDTTFFIALRAVDKANKNSEVSNVASVQISIVPEDGLSGGAIAGIVIGVLAVVALSVVVAFMIIRKKKTLEVTND